MSSPGWAPWRGACRGRLWRDAHGAAGARQHAADCSSRRAKRGQVFEQARPLACPLRQGWNARGTLGRGHRELHGRPARVPGLEGVRIKQAAIGGYGPGPRWCQTGAAGWQGCRLAGLPQGRCFCCWAARRLAAASAAARAAASAAALENCRGGRAFVGCLCVPNRWTPSCRWHVLAVDDTGQCWAWGGNEYNQCVPGEGKRDITTPVRCLPGVRVRQVATGGMHSLALTEEGAVRRGLGSDGLVWLCGALLLLVQAGHGAAPCWALWCWARQLAGHVPVLAWPAQVHAPVPCLPNSTRSSCGASPGATSP